MTDDTPHLWSAVAAIWSPAEWFRLDNDCIAMSLCSPIISKLNVGNKGDGEDSRTLRSNPAMPPSMMMSSLLRDVLVDTGDADGVSQNNRNNKISFQR